jgi:hypothetical protein
VTPVIVLIFLLASMKNRTFESHVCSSLFDFRDLKFTVSVRVLSSIPVAGLIFLCIED